MGLFDYSNRRITVNGWLYRYWLWLNKSWNLHRSTTIQHFFISLTVMTLLVPIAVTRNYLTRN